MLHEKKIIAFDGVCSLCNNYILFVARNDKNDHFRFISLQNKKTKTIFKNLNINIEKEESILLLENNTLQTKSDAIISIVSKLKFPYNIFTVIYIIPKKIRDYIYLFIAKNRYKMFNKIACCSTINNKINTSYMKNKIIY